MSTVGEGQARGARRRYGDSPRWPVAAIGALRAAVSRSHVPRAGNAPRAPRAERGAAVDADLDQDRRLPRRLRLLSAGAALRHGRRRAGIAGARDGTRGRQRGEGAGCDALLHGRRVARAERARPRTGARDGPRGEGARARDLLHARDVARRAGRGAQGRGPRLLQPQPRHGAGVLRRSDHDARLPGSTRHARARARGGRGGVLRRHRRHGRIDGSSARR